LFGGFLTPLNIRREKEIETIEQMNVTPIKKTSIHFRQKEQGAFSHTIRNIKFSAHP
jgi:hypothetical protein